MRNRDLIESAFKNIRRNLLRAVITLSIIAFGIAALVGILTAIDTAIYTMSANFSSLGSTSFSIRPAEMEIDRIERGQKVKQAKEISYQEATDFKNRYPGQGIVSISMMASRAAVARYGEVETNPVLRLIGTDENELYTRGHEMAHGRFMTGDEVRSAVPKAVIGHFVASTLFSQPERALHKKIHVDGRAYRVIGVLVEKGASMNESSDKRVIIPVTLAREIYAHSGTNYQIDVGVTELDAIDDMITEAIGLMRKVRRLKAKDDNDFRIVKADGLIGLIEENTVKLRWSAIGIGIITLLGAAIGLMNIMLVSVTERTREIGVLKSFGATKESIIKQFLLEALIICQLGGVMGIILGILSGIIVSKLLEGSFVMPWSWILLGIFLCMVVGLISGIYPARKAAQLDPIESLRYD